MLRVGNLKNKTAAARFAKIEANGNPKIIDLDYIDIHDVHWNRDQGYLQLTFRLGYVEDGKFIASDKYPAHVFQIERGSQPAIWQKYNLETMEWFDRLELILHQESGVAHAAIVAWKLEGVESLVE